MKYGCYRVGGLDLVVVRAASVWGGYRVGRFELAVRRATRRLGRQLG
jgi:hypothetical protein